MLSNLHSYIHLIFIGFIALFPVVNPIGTAFMINPYFSGLSSKQRVHMVKRIVFYALCICTFTLLVGHWILELFGLSIAIVQLAGGIMICKIGWEFLASGKSNDSKEKEQKAEPKKEIKEEELLDLESKLFYPITFPVTTGAGTIAVLFTLGAHTETTDLKIYLMNLSALMCSIILTCVLIFVCYTNAHRLIHYIGSTNEKIVNRLMAFLIFCVGLQIAVGGIKDLIKTF